METGVTKWLRNQMLYQRYEEWRLKNPLNLKAVNLKEFSREEHASFRNYSSECYRIGTELYGDILSILRSGVELNDKLPLKELEQLLESLRSINQQHKDNWVLFYRT